MNTIIESVLRKLKVNFVTERYEALNCYAIKLSDDKFVIVNDFNRNEDLGYEFHDNTTGSIITMNYKTTQNVLVAIIKEWVE